LLQHFRTRECNTYVVVVLICLYFQVFLPPEIFQLLAATEDLQSCYANDKRKPWCDHSGIKCYVYVTSRKPRDHSEAVNISQSYSVETFQKSGHFTKIGSVLTLWQKTKNGNICWVLVFCLLDIPNERNAICCSTRKTIDKATCSFSLCFFRGPNESK